MDAKFTSRYGLKILEIGRKRTLATSMRPTMPQTDVHRGLKTKNVKIHFISNQ